MCGRYTIGSRMPGEFDVRFGGSVDIGGLGRYNVAPTEPVPIVSGGPGLAERTADMARWGLRPPWASRGRRPLQPINARVETLHEKRLFAPLVAAAEHRVLVLADGWYEWLRSEDPEQPRVPFHHVVDGGGPIAFAGLARTAGRRGDPPEDRIVSVAIVTCAANAVAGRIHDRMPAVLAGPDEEAAWLAPDVGGPEAAALCVALPDDRLEIRPASPLVNSVRSPDGPWLLDPEVVAPKPAGGPPGQAQLTLGDDAGA